jgi:hypothetical protein
MPGKNIPNEESHPLKGWLFLCHFSRYVGFDWCQQLPWLNKSGCEGWFVVFGAPVYVGRSAIAWI